MVFYQPHSSVCMRFIAASYAASPPILVGAADYPNLDWGAPVVQPRCLVGGGQRLNCHKGELEHCLAIGLYDFSQLGLGGADGVLGMLPHAGGVGVAHGDEGDSSHDVVLVSDDDDEGAVIDVALVSSDDDDDEGVVVIDVVMVSSDDDEDEDVRVRW